MKFNLNLIQVAITAAFWVSICIYFQLANTVLFMYYIFHLLLSIVLSSDISAASSVKRISEVTTNVFSYHSRTTVHIHKYTTMFLEID